MADIDRSRQHTLTAITVTCVGIGTIVVLARLCVRHFIVRSVGKDDIAMLIGWLATVAYMVEILLSVATGCCIPTTATTRMVELMQITLAIECTYYLAIAAVKISILLFYLRLVDSGLLLGKLCWGTIALLVVFLVTCEIATLAQCIPLQKLWDFFGAMEGGHCFNTTAFFYSTSAFNIITDVWIIALPIRMLSKIHRPKREVVGLIIVFGMGCVAAIFSIVRLQSIRTFTLSTDPFFDGDKINIWSILEINIAIVCASIPALKPLFSSKRNGSSGYPASSSFGKPTSDSYRLGPLTPGDSKSRINTKISSVPRSRTRLEKSEKPRGFDDNDSEEAINNPNDFNDIEMSRDFRFTEERIERNR